MFIDHLSHKSSGSNSPELKICKCLSNKPFDVSALPPFNNSEADTRIILHLAHATGQGRQTDYVRTVDSDIVVLAIIRFSQQLDCQSFGWVSVVGKKNSAIYPSMIYLLRCIWHCMPSNGARQQHTVLNVVRRLLGNLDKIHQVSLKHWWH